MARDTKKQPRRKGPFTAHITTPEDVAAALRALAGGKSIHRLVKEHGDVSKSVGAWHGWLKGTREPTLRNFIKAVKSLGGKVVISGR